MAKKEEPNGKLDKLLAEIDTTDMKEINAKYQEAIELVKNAHMNRKLVYNNQESQRLEYYTITVKVTARTDSPLVSADCIGVDIYEALEDMYKIDSVDIVKGDVCGRLNRASGGMSEVAYEQEQEQCPDEGYDLYKENEALEKEREEWEEKHGK